ncbi:MAG: hypothetical protein U5L11_12250, partial [Arhodomonas sp.]|nr:hypothetical protein [Arhodomonas sp.]
APITLGVLLDMGVSASAIGIMLATITVGCAVLAAIAPAPRRRASPKAVQPDPLRLSRLNATRLDRASAVAYTNAVRARCACPSREIRRGSPECMAGTDAEAQG